MKYLAIAIAIVAFSSCEQKNTYRCDCSSNRGRILYTYDAELKQAKDGMPGCELAEDSIAAVYPNAQVQCYFYNLGN